MHEYHREAETGGRLEAEHVYENRGNLFPVYFCVTVCVCESEGVEMSVCVVLNTNYILISIFNLLFLFA